MSAPTRGEHAATGTPSRLAWLVFAVVLVIHLVALYAPRGAGESLFPGIDKLTHAALFGGLLVSAWWLGAGLRWLVPLLAVHAVESEVVQALLLPHRDGNLGDVVADWVGILLGILVGLLVCRAIRSRGGRPHAG